MADTAVSWQMSIAKTGRRVGFALLLPPQLGAVDVIVPPIDMALDGYLREWGPRAGAAYRPGLWWQRDRPAWGLRRLSRLRW